MAEPVGDLVVDLSLDAARFDEQMATILVIKSDSAGISLITG